jgi:hypothetical protein
LWRYTDQKTGKEEKWVVVAGGSNDNSVEFLRLHSHKFGSGAENLFWSIPMKSRYLKA